MDPHRFYVMYAREPLTELGLQEGDGIFFYPEHPPGQRLRVGEYLSDDRLHLASWALVHGHLAVDHGLLFGEVLESLERAIEKGAGKPASRKERSDRRRALNAALAAPLAAAPQEPHAAVLLGTVGFSRLARSLAHIRQERGHPQNGGTDGQA